MLSSRKVKVDPEVQGAVGEGFNVLGLLIAAIAGATGCDPDVVGSKLVGDFAGLSTQSKDPVTGGLAVSTTPATKAAFPYSLSVASTATTFHLPTDFNGRGIGLHPETRTRVVRIRVDFAGSDAKADGDILACVLTGPGIADQNIALPSGGWVDLPLPAAVVSSTNWKIVVTTGAEVSATNVAKLFMSCPEFGVRGIDEFAELADENLARGSSNLERGTSRLKAIASVAKEYRDAGFRASAGRQGFAPARATGPAEASRQGASAMSRVAGGSSASAATRAVLERAGLRPRVAQLSQLAIPASALRLGRDGKYTVDVGIREDGVVEVGGEATDVVSVGGSVSDRTIVSVGGSISGGTTGGKR